MFYSSEGTMTFRGRRTFLKVRLASVHLTLDSERNSLVFLGLSSLIRDTSDEQEADKIEK